MTLRQKLGIAALCGTAGLGHAAIGAAAIGGSAAVFACNKPGEKPLYIEDRFTSVVPQPKCHSYSSGHSLITICLQDYDSDGNFDYFSAMMEKSLLPPSEEEKKEEKAKKIVEAINEILDYMQFLFKHYDDRKPIEVFVNDGSVLL